MGSFFVLDASLPADPRLKSKTIPTLLLEICEGGVEGARLAAREPVERELVDGVCTFVLPGLMPDSNPSLVDFDRPILLP